MITKKQVSQEKIAFFQELTKLPTLKKVEQFIDNEMNSVYDAFLLSTDTNQFVLKKAEAKELEVNKKLAASNFDLPLPKLVNSFYFEKNNWLLMEYFNGTDLQRLTTDSASQSGIALATITNSFYDEKAKLKTDESKILARLAVNSILQKAYRLYLTRQEAIPVSFIHDDCLPINVLFDGQQIAIVDWAYGKIGSYVADVSRLYAFYDKSKTLFHSGYSFLDSDNNKEEILVTFYRNLSPKLKKSISQEQFESDVALECLNQYLLNLGAPSMIVEEQLDSEWEKHFFQKAVSQATTILESQ